MKGSRILFVLTLVNLLLLLFNLTRSQPVSAAGAVLSQVRTRVFEVVDEKGVVRAQIKAQPEDGAVVFRLRDQKGNLRVKIGAEENSSGIVLTDNTTQPGVHMLARSNETFVKVIQGNKEQSIKPN